MNPNPRIARETQKLKTEPIKGITAVPDPDNYRYFHVTIEGPEGSPYENGLFSLELFLPADYPMVAPKVRFLTKTYHPNLDALGRICLDTIKGAWSPALQIPSVLLSIQNLLLNPEPSDPKDTRWGEHWKSKRAEAEAQAR